ncbi:MAG: DUF5777 family beta-barrel protein [Candidatus Cloacimonetes bacterium]|nr:DUF5777 family beta-barrel protein [Candidatus Cloacimonadota bacterium]
MKRFVVIVMLSFIIPIFAYDVSMLNLINPSGLKKGLGELMIQHRFYGDITDDPLANFLGIDTGANVGLSARYHFLQNAEAKLSYSRRKSEKSIGVSYKIQLEDFPVNGQAGIDYFSYEEVSQEKTTRRNFFYYFSAQNQPLFERFVATLNMAYDGYNQRFVLGCGIAVKIVNDISLLAEYYPVLDRNSADFELSHYIGTEDAFAFGFRFDTYGHQFTFLLANTDDIGLRRVSLGTRQNSYLRLGFNIQRKME